MKGNIVEIPADIEPLNTLPTSRGGRRKNAKAPSAKPVLEGLPKVVVTETTMGVSYVWLGESECARACVDAHRIRTPETLAAIAPIYGKLPSDVWEIVRVETHRQGIGMGTLVMAEAMRQFALMGAQAVVLEPLPDQRGNLKRLWAFYERFGFRAAIPGVPKGRTGMIWTPPIPEVP